MAFHVAGTLPPSAALAARFGWMGVDLFFVLSGYLISRQLLTPYLNSETLQLWPFYRKRFYRVLPAYLVVLTLYFAFPSWREQPGISPLWQFLTFTENLFVDYGVNQAFSHAWSLCVEEHFYLVLPILVVWMMRKPSLSKTVAVITTFVLFGIGIRSFVLFHPLRPLARSGLDFGLVYIERIYYPTYSRLDGLIAGVSLAAMQLFRPAWWSALHRRSHTLLCVGATFIALAIWLFRDRWETVTGASAVGTVIGFPILSLGLALMVASALSSNGLLARFNVPGAKTIAALSYSLYLTHKEIINLDARYFPTLHDAAGPLWFAVLAATCLAAATILYLCVERPFMILREIHSSKQSAAANRAITAEPAL
jgi:peptidoglycan/LPS O-acetylase OafA/YrhL